MDEALRGVRRVVGGLALMTSVVLVAAAVVAFAGERGSKVVDRDDVITIPADLSALRVVIDPESGELRQPTAAEAQAFDASFMAEIAAKAGEAEVYTMANGARGARLGVAGINAAVVTVGADGQPHVGCLEHDDKHPSHVAGEEVR